jgi:hypothetical protein
MTISKKKKNNKYKSKKNQYGGNVCKLPIIWENEQTGECVKKCPTDTCPRYDISGNFKCATKKCMWMTPALRSGLTSLKNKTTAILLGKTVSDTGITFGTTYGESFIYYGPLKSGKPHGIGLAIAQGNWEYFGNFNDGKFNGDGSLVLTQKQFMIEGKCFDANTSRDRDMENIIDYSKVVKISFFFPGNDNTERPVTLEGLFPKEKDAEGEGKAIYGNGDIFIGKFVNNKPFFGQLKSKDPEYPGVSLYIQGYFNGLTVSGEVWSSDNPDYIVPYTADDLYEHYNNSVIAYEAFSDAKTLLNITEF